MSDEHETRAVRQGRERDTGEGLRARLGGRGIDAYLSLVDLGSRLTEFVAVVLLFGFGALMLAEVVARGFLGTSLPYSWEYSTYAMAGVFFLGLGSALRHGTHVRVSLLLERGGPVAARRIDRLATLVALVFATVILGACLALVQGSFERGLRAASVTATPLAVPQTLALVGALQLVLELVARLIRLLRAEPPEWRPGPAPGESTHGEPTHGEQALARPDADVARERVGSR